MKKFSATNENLATHALEPTFRWLIAVALDGDVMTYGDVKQKLEDEADFSTIFATRIGFVAGTLMARIQEIVPDAPLINVLVVNQSDRVPSKGAGSFMAKRFNKPKLADDEAKTKYPRLWEETFRRAAAEVYAFGADDWARLYERVFGSPLQQNDIKQLRDDLKQGAEQDGVPTGRKYGAGGEGEYHKNLRMWIKANPGAVHKSFIGAEAETEFDLPSGDRVDVVYKCADRTVLLEVKSRISNEFDLKRGVYQCIKYRAVRAAMDVREDPTIDTYLVTELGLPGEIAALLRLHEIKHFLAPVDRT